MLALARYTLKGPYQAAATVALLAVLAVVTPLLVQSTPLALLLAFVLSMVMQFVSCTLVGLIILTQGSVSGLKPIVVSIVGISLTGWWLVGLPELGISTGLLQWLPIILLAQTLRSTKSLALTLLAGVVLGVIAVAGQYLLMGDIQAQWLSMMQQGGGPVDQENQELAAGYLGLMHWLVVNMVPMSYVIFVSIVLMARSLQARLSDSQGFAKEFCSLTLGKPASMVALVIIVGGMVIQQNWLSSLGLLVLSAFLFQGIAVLHSKIASRKQAGVLLKLYYFLLLFLWRIAMPLTAITGIADNWLAFRKKN